MTAALVRDAGAFPEAPAGGDTDTSVALSRETLEQLARLVKAQALANPPAPVILVDARVLSSRILRAYLLQAAAQGLLGVTWSSSILDEARARAAANDPAPDLATLGSWVEPTHAEFARVATIPAVSNQVRAAIAAALANGAGTICTLDVWRYPAFVMTAFRLNVATPDEVLTTLVGTNMPKMLAAHRQVVRQFSPQSDAHALAAVHRTGSHRLANVFTQLLHLGVEAQKPWRYVGGAPAVPGTGPAA